MKKPIWRSTITSGRPGSPSGNISTPTTLSAATPHWNIRHRLNATIRQCCCPMQLSIYGRGRKVLHYPHPSPGNLSTISVHYKNFRFLSWQLSHYIWCWWMRRNFSNIPIHLIEFFSTVWTFIWYESIPINFFITFPASGCLRVQWNSNKASWKYSKKSKGILPSINWYYSPNNRKYGSDPPDYDA